MTRDQSDAVALCWFGRRICRCMPEQCIWAHRQYRLVDCKALVQVGKKVAHAGQSIPDRLYELEDAEHNSGTASFVEVGASEPAVSLSKEYRKWSQASQGLPESLHLRIRLDDQYLSCFRCAQSSVFD